MEHLIDVEFPMQILYIAKSSYDHGRLEALLSKLGGDSSIAEDNIGYVELAMLECMYEDTRSYWHSGWRSNRDTCQQDRDIYVLRDPLLTRYDDLCRKLEAKLGITKVENQFARDLESVIHRNMQLNSYSYEYLWIDSTRESKGGKIVLMLFPEFGAYYDIPHSLFSILDFCQEGIPQLEAALAETSRENVIQLPVEPASKEAA